MLFLSDYAMHDTLQHRIERFAFRKYGLDDTLSLVNMLSLNLCSKTSLHDTLASELGSKVSRRSGDFPNCVIQHSLLAVGRQIAVAQVCNDFLQHVEACS